MAILAILSVIMVYWHDTGGVAGLTPGDLVIIDFFVVGIFLLDWSWFLYRSDDRRGYLKRTWWDLLGMIPLYFSGVGFLRLFRLFRLFRVLRALRVMKRLLDSGASIAKRSKLGYIAFVSITITLGGAVLVWAIEKGSNPALDHFSEAIWWAIVTVTTVGYGDITPQTSLGRIVAGMMMLTGIGTIALLASQVSATLVREKEEEISEEAIAEQVPDTVAGQLTALAALRHDGDLTEEEYAAAKQKVLSR